MGIFKNIFDYETKELKKINKLTDQVEALDEEMTKLKDVEIKKYFDAEMQFNVMIADINKIIAEAIKDVL